MANPGKPLLYAAAAHFSTASMAFEQTDKGAKMTLEQSGVPESDIERTKQVDFPLSILSVKIL